MAANSATNQALANTTAQVLAEFLLDLILKQIHCFETFDPARIDTGHLTTDFHIKG